MGNQQSAPPDEPGTGASGERRSTRRSTKALSTGPPITEEQVRKRQHISKEILDTERKYVHHLDTLCRVYIAPLKESASSNKGMIRAEDIKLIFSIVEVIANFHKTFLDEVEARVQNWGPVQCIGDVFLKNLDFFKFYSTYVNGYNEAMMCISRCTDKNKQFAEFLEAAAHNPATDLLDLASFLIMPIQRLPRYVMLLADLLKNTPASHPDHANLTQALQRLKSVADFVNEAKRKAENAQKVMEVQNSLCSSKHMNGPLVVPHRKFIAEGDLAYHPPPKTSPLALKKSPSSSIFDPSSPPPSPSNLRNKQEVLHFHLFNDCILLSREDKSLVNFRKSDLAKKWRVKVMAKLTQVETKYLPDTPTIKYAFEVIVAPASSSSSSSSSPSVSRSFVFSATDQATKEDWIKQLYLLRSQAMPRKEVVDAEAEEIAAQNIDKQRKEEAKRQKEEVKKKQEEDKRRAKEEKAKASQQEEAQRKKKKKKGEKEPLIKKGEKKKKGICPCFG
eukprot:TRINITY_DN4070_c0_g2_i7.p1 TRINITY_DN4070_c0_g2~~TRINITY_DN4070_c0_g2_i7.p1  ORF type:complete len:504 (+),score=185.83 TRINITY_DN4070_c0_g2_i7:192-1703(+)